MLAVRARALLDGRLAPSLDDVVALAEPVLKHRMALTFAARAEGVSVARPDRRARGGDAAEPMAGMAERIRGDSAGPRLDDGARRSPRAPAATFSSRPGASPPP